MNNYIQDRNRFNLAGPPLSWLRKLWDFDSSLVVIPSRQDFVYRLAQRRKLSPTANLVSSILADSDTQMLASYGLVPVTTIISTANWSNPLLFEELRNRAPHRLGGAEKVEAALLAQEKGDEIRKGQALDEQLTYTARDAWKFYNTKIGTRGTVDLGAAKPAR